VSRQVLVRTAAPRSTGSHLYKKESGLEWRCKLPVCSVVLVKTVISRRIFYLSDNNIPLLPGITGNIFWIPIDLWFSYFFLIKPFISRKLPVLLPGKSARGSQRSRGNSCSRRAAVPLLVPATAASRRSTRLTSDGAARWLQQAATADSSSCRRDSRCSSRCQAASLGNLNTVRQKNNTFCYGVTAFPQNTYKILNKNTGLWSSRS